MKNNQNNKEIFPIFELKKYNSFIINSFDLDIPLNIINENKFVSCKTSDNIVDLFTHDDDSGNQKWIIGKYTDNNYFIKSQSTNKYLGSNDGNNIILFDDINEKTIWKIIESENNIFNLMLIDNTISDNQILIIGKNIYDSYKTLHPNNNNVILFDDGDENTNWEISKIKNNFFALTNPPIKSVIKPIIKPAIKSVIKPAIKSIIKPAIKSIIKPFIDGYPIFELKKYNTFIIDNFMLDVPLNLKNDNYFLSCTIYNEIVDLYTHDDDSGNQKWIIEKNTDTTYFIRSQSTQKYLGSNDFNNVILFEYKNNKTIWRIVKISDIKFRLMIVKNMTLKNDTLINSPLINTEYNNKIISYDMFDTLIFRYCNQPDKIFDIIQEKVSNPNYKSHRCKSEDFTYKNYDNGNIDVIYDNMKKIYNYDDDTIDYYKKIEIETEIDNIYPNNELFLKLREQDIIVSDMYLKEEHLRLILKKCVEYNRNILHGNNVNDINIDNIKIYV